MANQLIGTTVLADAENIVIIPLQSVTMIYTNLSLCFVTWEYDQETNEEREICSLQFTHLPFPGPPPRVPILFEVVGQIIHEECFFTVDGYESPESSGQEDERLATCWIEPRHDFISRIYWLGIVPAIQEIANHVPGDLDTSRVLAEDHGQDILQVCYQPPAGQSLASTLPFYNIEGAREVPSCLAEVPFGQPVRAAFALEASYSREKPDERVLLAVLEHMVVM